MKTQAYLELCYGKLRDISPDLGVMLGTDYKCYPNLDGLHTMRIVMNMNDTEIKYVEEALEFFVGVHGEWKGPRLKTPLSPPVSWAETKKKQTGRSWSDPR